VPLRPVPPIRIILIIVLCALSSDHAPNHLESLSVIHPSLCPSDAGQAYEKVLIPITSMLLRLVLAQCINLFTNMPHLQMNKSRGSKGQIVPGHFVSQDIPVLEGPQPFLVQDLMILVYVIRRGHKYKVRFDLAANPDQIFQDLLAMLGEMPDRIAVHQQVVRADVQDVDGFLGLRSQDVSGKALRHRGLADRESHIVNSRALFDEPSQRAPATHFTVVGVRGQNERPGAV
jgi:hypothetical protein